MQEELQTPTNISISTTNNISPDDMDSACSTPYVSAPSSPGHGQPLISGYYYSAPASPMHFVLSATPLTTGNTSQAEPSSASSFEFDFSAKLKSDGATSPESMTMSSADELFFNGQIRPMKLSTHLQRPQILSPLLDVEENDQDSPDQLRDQGCVSRGRDKSSSSSSLRNRRTRSLSPLRTASFEWRQQKCEIYDEIVTCTQNQEKENDASDGKNDDRYEDTISSTEATWCNYSGSSSRSKRWVLLKEFLYRSKSEGRNNGNKFWNGLSSSFSSPIKEKKMEKMPRTKPSNDNEEKGAKSQQNIAAKDTNKRVVNGKAVNGVMRKRRVPPSAHELHYTANRAQSEEMRKKTFLPYRQGLLGCLGFSSKSYGAWNGFARALNPVSSR